MEISYLYFKSAEIINSYKSMTIFNSLKINKEYIIKLSGDSKLVTKNEIIIFKSSNSYQLHFNDNNFKLLKYQDIEIITNTNIINENLNDLNYIIFNKTIIYFDIVPKSYNYSNILIDCIIYKNYFDDLYKILLEMKNKQILNHNFLLIKSNVNKDIDEYKSSECDNESYNEYEYNLIVTEINNYKYQSKYYNIISGPLDLIDYNFFNQWVDLWLNEFTKPLGRYYSFFIKENNKDEIINIIKLYRIKKIYHMIDLYFIKKYNLQIIINQINDCF